MKYLILLVSILFSLHAFSDSSIDYTQAVDLDTAPKQQLLPLVRVLVEADSTTLDAAEVIDSDAYLPEGALVTRVFYKVINKFESANGNTLALGCSSSTDDLVSAQQIYGYASDDVIVVTSFGSSGDIVAIGSGGCQIRALVGAGASGLTAGRGVFFFEYLVGED